MPKPTRDTTADRLLEKARRIHADDTLLPNAREYQFARAMEDHATWMVSTSPKSQQPRWHSVVQEWNKRTSVALKAVAQDEYQQILRAVEARRADSEALARLR